LAGNIGISAKHRFFHPEDIDGSGLSRSSKQVNLLQATLQNTLEQAALAIPVYMATSDDLQPLPLLSSAMFVIGRIFFWKGYSQGVPSRAFGFALTFYSTVTLDVTKSWVSRFKNDKVKEVTIHVTSKM
jgi:lambda repressor-like predicted transcriptional regulator